MVSLAFHFNRNARKGELNNGNWKKVRFEKEKKTEIENKQQTQSIKYTRFEHLLINNVNFVDIVC